MRKIVEVFFEFHSIRMKFLPFFSQSSAFSARLLCLLFSLAFFFDCNLLLGLLSFLWLSLSLLACLICASASSSWTF